jgi:hypothetical protein
MRAPITFVYGNCVFAQGFEDCWAAFAVEVSTYAWLGEAEKHSRLLELVGVLEALEADVQIVRVQRRFPVEGDAVGSGPMARVSAGNERARRRYVEEHVDRMGSIGGSQPVLFVFVSLQDPEQDVASYVSKAAGQHPREWWSGIRRAASMRDRRVLAASELEWARVRADRAHARMLDFLPVRPAHSAELQWLIRRAFCRSLGEPLIDGLHEPRALAFERNGKAVLAPLEGDVLRWGSLVPFP